MTIYKGQFPVNQITTHQIDKIMNWFLFLTDVSNNEETEFKYSQQSNFEIKFKKERFHDNYKIKLKQTCWKEL